MNAVLIICGDPEARQQLSEKLRGRSNVYHWEGLPSPMVACDTPFDLVFLDISLMPPKADDPFDQIRRQIRMNTPWTQFVALCPREYTRNAVDMVKRGAADYLTYPFDDDEIDLVMEKLQQVLEKHFELEYLRDRFWKSDWLDVIHTTNPAMHRIVKNIRSVAPTIATVLLLGQTGTGKGLMARLIHRHSYRSEDPFVVVHCGAIPDTLIESELFGHERGAFTGAERRKIGRFELARNGTIFLDEIGTISSAAQVKLLQVLQDGTFSRLGSGEILKTNARIIAATNADLEQLAAKGDFRRDLFYRLNIFPIQLPSLSERPEDIPHLVDYFLKRLNEKYGKKIKGLQTGLMADLQAYDWPGNLRELENVLERACILESGDLLGPETFPESLIIGSKIFQALEEDRPLPLAQARQIAIDTFERTYLETLLKKHGGKINVSAKEACITSRQFNRLATKHGLDKKRFKP